MAYKVHRNCTTNQIHRVFNKNDEYSVKIKLEVYRVHSQYLYANDILKSWTNKRPSSSISVFLLRPDKI